MATRPLSYLLPILLAWGCSGSDGDPEPTAPSAAEATGATAETEEAESEDTPAEEASAEEASAEPLVPVEHAVTPACTATIRALVAGEVEEDAVTDVLGPDRAKQYATYLRQCRALKERTADVGQLCGGDFVDQEQCVGMSVVYRMVHAVASGGSCEPIVGSAPAPMRELLSIVCAGISSDDGAACGALASDDPKRRFDVPCEGARTGDPEACAACRDDHCRTICPRLANLRTVWAGDEAPDLGEDAVGKMLAEAIDPSFSCESWVEEELPAYCIVRPEPPPHVEPDTRGPPPEAPEPCEPSEAAG